MIWRLRIWMDSGWGLAPNGGRGFHMLNAKDQECFREVSAEIRSVYPDARIWAFGLACMANKAPIPTWTFASCYRNWIGKPG